MAIYEPPLTMEVYRDTLDDKTLLLLTTDGDFLKYLEAAKSSPTSSAQ